MSDNPPDASVASHRPHHWWNRVGAHRPWVAPTVWLSMAALAGAAVIVSALNLTADPPQRCAGPTTMITVVAAPAHAPVLGDLANRWSAGAPEHNGRCIGAAVVAKASSEVATALGPGWDTARDGPRPHVWAPDSSLWLTVAASRQDAAALLPAQPPSIASSPVVLAVRQQMAEALGWPQRMPGAFDVLGAFAQPDTWTKVGHPEWTGLRVGMPDPSVSTPGLASVLSILDPEATGTISDAQLIASIRMTQALGAMAADVATFFAAQSEAAGQGATSNVAAFPALERDLATYRAGNPPTTMVPVYLPQQSIVADHPYAVLAESWVGADHRAAADQFLNYVLSPAGQDALAAKGLRGPDGSVRDAAVLPAEQGFAATIAAPRVTPDAATLNQLITEWTALQRPANVLVVLDTSGSMKAPVPGTDLTRMQLLQQTATTGFGLLTNQTNIGLWEFSAPANNLTNRYRELVPFGPIAAPVGSVPRQRALVAAAGNLRAVGYTPLYDTTQAAFREMQNRWQPNSTNAVLLITDGANEMPDGQSLTQLIERLRGEARTDQPTRIISIAVGPEADVEALQQISEATGGRAFVATDPAKAVQMLILAFAGRLQ